MGAGAAPLRTAPAPRPRLLEAQHAALVDGRARHLDAAKSRPVPAQPVGEPQAQVLKTGQLQPRMIVEQTMVHDKVFLGDDLLFSLSLDEMDALIAM